MSYDSLCHKKRWRYFFMKKIITLSLICLVFLCGCNANSSKKYSEKQLVNICGFSDYDKMDINYRGTDCTYYEGIGLDKENPCYGVKFYIFKSASKAKEAYDADVNDAVNYFLIEEQNDSDIRYWVIENGGDARRFEHVSGNLLMKVQFEEVYYFTEDGNSEEREMTPGNINQIDWLKTNF